MQTKAIFAVSAGFLAAAIVLSLGPVSAILMAFGKTATSEAWAAWLQAIGSIAAVAGSAWVARWQFAANEAARQIERLQRAQAYSSIIIDTARYVECWVAEIHSAVLNYRRQVIGNPGVLAKLANEGATHAEDLVKLREISIDVAGATTALIDLDRAIAFTAHSVGRMFIAPPYGKTAERHIAECLEDFDTWHALAVDRLEKLLAICFTYS